MNKISYRNWGAICLVLFSTWGFSQNPLSELPYLTKNNLVYYSFDKIQNNRIENLSDTMFNARVLNALVSPGKSGDALAFNDSNSMVLMDSLPYSESFTVMAWLKPFSYGKGPDAMLVFEKCMSFYMNIITQDGLFEKKKGFLRCGGHFTTSEKNAGWEYINSSDSIPVNEWTHAAVTFYSGSFKLYINGQLVSEKEIRPVLMESDLPATWGSKYNPKIDGFDGWFHGIIDESFMFSRALSNEEIKTYYNFSSAH